MFWIINHNAYYVSIIVELYRNEYYSRISTKMLNKRKVRWEKRYIITSSSICCWTIQRNMNKQTTSVFLQNNISTSLWSALTWNQRWLEDTSKTEHIAIVFKIIRRNILEMSNIFELWKPLKTIISYLHDAISLCVNTISHSHNTTN